VAMGVLGHGKKKKIGREKYFEKKKEKKNGTIF
jgi:hypothetical protein